MAVSVYLAVNYRIRSLYAYGLCHSLVLLFVAEPWQDSIKITALCQLNWLQSVCKHAYHLLAFFCYRICPFFSFMNSQNATGCVCLRPVCLFGVTMRPLQWCDLLSILWSLMANKITIILHCTLLTVLVLDLLKYCVTFALSIVSMSFSFWQLIWQKQVYLRVGLANLVLEL